MRLNPAPNEQYAMENWLGSLKNYNNGEKKDYFINNINLIGTHNSAAIRPYTYIPGLYSCQTLSIESQLKAGIRLLDIRLKVKRQNNDYYFVTCHGEYSLKVGMNEYEPLSSVLNTCEKFLTDNPDEFIVMCLRIDDGNGYETDENKPNIHEALSKLLQNYPVFINTRLPTLSQASGKICLLDRITEAGMFGPFLYIPHNTDGFGDNSLHQERDFTYFTQDKYDFKDSSDSQVKVAMKKWDVFQNALFKKKIYDLVYNFASAVSAKGVMGVEIHALFLKYLGEKDALNRYPFLGWSLFDFPEKASTIYELKDDYLGVTERTVTMIDLIVDSNFKYARFPKAFSLNKYDA